MRTSSFDDKPASDFVFFDAHLHSDGLSDQDLRSMSFFGLAGALVPARDAVCPTVKDFVAYFEGLVCQESVRLSQIGIKPYTALGIHPARIPSNGLEQILAAIPRLAIAGRLVAIGEIGLEKGGAREEQVMQRQLELAIELRLPVLVHTPSGEKPRLTRRICAILKESGISPDSVLVGHASDSTLRIILECGFWAGLSINPVRLSSEKAASLIGSYGCQGIIVSSDSGDGAHDILALPHTAYVMDKLGLAFKIIKRVLRRNALGFLRLERTNN